MLKIYSRYGMYAQEYEKEYFGNLENIIQGLTKSFEKYYFKDDPELIEVLDPYLGNK